MHLNSPTEHEENILPGNRKQHRAWPSHKQIVCRKRTTRRRTYWAPRNTGKNQQFLYNIATQKANPPLIEVRPITRYSLHPWTRAKWEKKSHKHRSAHQHTCNDPKIKKITKKKGKIKWNSETKSLREQPTDSESGQKVRKQATNQYNNEANFQHEE